jgi:protein phosphatase
MIHYACQSHPGLLHNDNQDRWYADPLRRFFLVTDGMANDIAPELVVKRLPYVLDVALSYDDDPASENLHNCLQLALRELNEQVYEEMAARGELGLGTTLVLVFVREPRALVAHIGDSRVYLFRDEVLQPLTRDHSLLQRLLDQGLVSEEEARRARSNGGPTRFLGQSDEVEAELNLVEISDGDQLLLCSDGLTEMLSDEEIQAVFQKEMCPEDTCEQLVDAANAAGGRDNVTVLVVRVT